MLEMKDHWCDKDNNQVIYTETFNHIWLNWKTHLLRNQNVHVRCSKLSERTF